MKTRRMWEENWDVVRNPCRPSRISGSVRKFSSLALFAALFTSGPILAQEVIPDPDTADGPPAAVAKNGLHVYQVSGSVGYSSVSGLLGNGSDFRQLGCDCYGVGAITTGYSHTGPVNRFDAVYTPSYSNYYGLTGLQGFNQNMQVVFESRFSPKWKFSLVATADDSSVVEFALQPSSALNGGQDLGTFVSTTMSAVTPGQTLLYGGRVLSVGGRTGLTYRPTTRIRITFEGGFFQSQTRSGGSSQSGNYVIPRSRFENANVNATYSLTPRTEVGGEVSLLEYHTVLGDYRATVVGGTYARKLSRQWSVLADAGFGTYAPTSTPATLPKISFAGSQFTTTLGLGYHGRENSFMTTYRRMAGDLYGLASSSSQGVQSAWRWHQAGRNWSTYLELDYQRLTGGPLGDGANWEASAGVTRALSRRMSMSFSYGYLKSSLGSLAPVAVYNNNLSAQVVRLTFIFVPVPTPLGGNGGPLGGGQKTTP